MKKNLVFILIIILISIPVVIPLFHPGFFQTDDGEWMIIRFSAFHQALRDGQFPVRFLGRLNHGYGYPVANFLYPGFMYFAEPFHLIGFGFVDAIKIVMGLSMVGSALTMFAWLSKRFNATASIIGGVFYLYTPYHLYDLYKRGSVGEVLAFAIVPFILWQVERKSLFWSSIGLAFLIISHNTLAILFMPLIIIYKLLVEDRKKKKYFIRNTVYFILSSISVSAFFWVPAVFELQYTRFSSVQISNITEYFASTELIGVSTLIILGMAVAFLSRKTQDNEIKKLLLFFFVITIFGIFFSSDGSAGLWQVIPGRFIQFPFRLLSISIVGIAFISAYVFTILQNMKLLPFGILLLVALAYSSLPYIQPRESFDKGEGFYATNEDTTTVKNEYMPKWVKEEPKGHFENKVEGVAIENLLYNNKKISFTAKSKGNVIIHHIYYPGWTAYINGREVGIDYTNKKGLMQVAIANTPADVTLKFSEPPLRAVSNIVSLLSLIILAGICAKQY